jgi:hypothetical protein
MKDVKYYVKVSLIPVLVDKKQPQLSNEYHKIIINDDNTIISKYIELEKNVEDVLRELYKEYLRYDYDWSYKSIASCRKVNNVIEIIYLTHMPYIKDCNKNGKVVNMQELNLLEDKHYAKVAIFTSPESFR